MYIYIHRIINVVLCVRHFLLLAARNHESGPIVKMSKKLGNKGDCISIAKKLKLLDEFNELKNSGVKNANQDMHSDQNDVFCHGFDPRDPFIQSSKVPGAFLFQGKNVCVHVYIYIYAYIYIYIYCTYLF